MALAAWRGPELSPSSPPKTRHRLHQQRTSLGPVQDPHSPLQPFQSLGKPRSRQSSSRSRSVGMASSSSAVQYDFWLTAVFVLFSCLLMFYVKQSLWIDLIISGRILGFHDGYISEASVGIIFLQIMIYRIWGTVFCCGHPSGWQKWHAIMMAS